MKFAAVDIGNSFVKVYCWEDSVPQREVCPSVEDAVRLCAGADAVAFCTTRRLDSAELSEIEAAGWWEFRHGCRIPIALRYETPSTLGPDRLAAAIGARRLFPGEGVLVADVGTALTLDVVTAAGEFAGGNISVGYDLRLKALHEFTSRLPAVEMSFERERPFGTDTHSALTEGARWGVVNEIVGALRIARMEHGCDRLVLTGGGAPKAAADIGSIYGGKFNFVCVPSLVAEGLKSAYEYNHER